MKQPISPTQRALNLWAVVLIIWAFYRAQFRTELPPWFDEFVAKPIVFVIPVYWYVTHIEKKDFFEGIGLHLENFRKTMILGVGIGFIFFSTALFGNYVKTGSWALPTTVYTGSIFLAIFLSLATSITEEIISRGFILKRLYDESKSILQATVVGSLLFFFLHVPILFTADHIMGYTLLRVMLTDLILGFATSFFFLERKNLLLPILIHFFYTLSLYLFI